MFESVRAGTELADRATASDRSKQNARARASGVHPPNAGRSNGGVPDPAEAERLRATLGALLRRLRTERGLSQRRLAERAAVPRSTVVRLENGQRRPRPVTLEAIAYGLDHRDPGPLAAELAAAAGPSLRPDTPGGRNRRARHLRRAHRAAALRRVRIARAADRLNSTSVALLMSTLRSVPTGDPRTARELEQCIALYDQTEADLRASDRARNRARSARSWLAAADHPLDLQPLRYAEWWLDHG